MESLKQEKDKLEQNEKEIKNVLKEFKEAHKDINLEQVQNETEKAGSLVQTHAMRGDDKNKTAKALSKSKEAD